MTGYFNGVILLSFLVNSLLFFATDRLCGYPAKYGRIAWAALLGSVYTGACLLPGFHFLGNLLWRIVFFGLMTVVAYGLSKSALRKGLVLALLSFALGGAATGIGEGGAVGLLCGAAIVCLLCFFGFRGHIGSNTYIPVELEWGTQRLCLTALQDTGNTLKDPLTGRQVLVIDADAAEKLTGLTRDQLRDPVGSMEIMPGLRLIPYRTVGSNSFLLAMRFPKVKIGSWQGSSLVAFAPENLGTEGAYQALTGGTI